LDSTIAADHSPRAARGHPIIAAASMTPLSGLDVDHVHARSNVSVTMARASRPL